MRKRGPGHAARQKKTRQAAQRGDERRHRLVVEQKQERLGGRPAELGQDDLEDLLDEQRAWDTP